MLDTGSCGRHGNRGDMFMIKRLKTVSGSHTLWGNRRTDNMLALTNGNACKRLVSCKAGVTRLMHGLSGGSHVELRPL